MDSFERLQKPQLPPKDASYSSLTKGDISEIDYSHAQRVLNHFEMIDLGDYHNFSLLTNMILLAEVFENFKEVCLQHYGLDPAHNYASLVWSGILLLKMRGVEFDLVIDID